MDLHQLRIYAREVEHVVLQHGLKVAVIRVTEPLVSNARIHFVHVNMNGIFVRGRVDEDVLHRRPLDLVGRAKMSVLHIHRGRNAWEVCTSA
jgi:hypothetical protein